MVPSNVVIYRANGVARLCSNYEWMLIISILFGSAVGAFVYTTTHSFGVACGAVILGFVVVPFANRFVFWPRIEQQLGAAARRLDDRGLYVAHTGSGLFLSRTKVVLTGSELREDGGLPSHFILVEPFERGRPEHAELLEEAIREDVDELAETLRDEERLVERLTALGVSDPTDAAKTTSIYRDADDE